jgi:peptidyl-prolyl cis-trans isomerase C
MTTLTRLASTALLLALFGGLALAQNKDKPATKDAPAAPALTPTDRPPPVRPKGTAAKVNGQDLPLVSVERALLGIDSAKREEARAEILNFLIDNLLIDQALAHWKIEADPKEVQKQMDEFKKTITDVKQDYAKVLANLMLTEEELKEQVIGQIRWDNFVTQQGPEDKLKAFFEQNNDMFDGTMVRARHILLTPKTEAAKAEALKELQAIKLKIEADASKAVEAELGKLPAKPDAIAQETLRGKKMDEAFSAMAREKSQCPSNRDGGDLNWFPRVGSMVEPFAKAAFALKPFQVSDVLATEFGYHLVMVTARKQGDPTKFEAVKDAVKEVYGMKLREKVVDMMRKQAKIDIVAAK